MIEFILGTAGSGKSTLISEKISDDLSAGKKVILLVPEQTSINSEQSICTEAQKRNIPLTELEILNFKRLCNRVFREYGGIAYNSISGGAKALILWKALFSSVPVLHRYKTELDNAQHFIPLLLSAIGEFKSYNITPLQLSKASRAIENENLVLSEKISDLSVIYSQYENYLNKDFNDPSDDLTRLANILKKHNFFKGINLYIDSFSGFAPQEYSVLSIALKQADNVSISLCISDDDMEFAFENVKQTLKKLKEIASSTSHDIKITKLKGSKRFKSKALNFLENNLWKIGNSSVFSESTSAVKTITASNIYDEAEFVANDILSKIRQGASYRDFAVISRNAEDYFGVVDAIFDQYNIPCHVSIKTELSEKPIFKMILSALNIKNDGWKTESIVIFMKTGLAPVTRDECDELETYAFQWNIFGKSWYDDNDWYMSPNGYKEAMTEEDAMLLKRLNATRRKIVLPLLKLFESFDGTRTIKDLCLAVYTFITEIGADQKIADTGDDDEVRVWNSFCGTLDTLVNIVPDLKADAPLFSNLFSLVVNQTNVGNIPSSIDEVTVGSADKIRTNDIKHVYLLGVNEGVFPSACQENSFFSDNDKAELEYYGIILSPDSDVLSINELFYFYTSVCCASESVNVICPSADLSGNLLNPSIAFLRVKEMFPNAEHIITDNIQLSERIQSKIASFPFCISEQNSDESKALQRIYASDTEYSSLLSQTRQPLITEEENLSEKITDNLFKGDMYLTQSKLDNYVMCAFAYECNYILDLQQKNRFEFKPADTGTLIHKILEKFFSIVTDNEGRINKPSEEETVNIIDNITKDYLSRIFRTDKENKLTERSYQMFKRIRRSVKILVDNLLEEFAQSKFVPRFFEMKIFDSNSNNSVAPLEISLPDGNHAYIRGIADRIDICRLENDVYVRVIDYKTGNKDFSMKDIEIGLNLQMLLYLFSIWKDRSGTFRKALNIKGNIIPAGVLYCSAKLKNVSAAPDTSKEEIISQAASTLKRQGILLNDKEILKFMEKNLEGKYIPVKLKKDGQISSTLSLQSIDEFNLLMEKVCAKVSDIAYKIKSGNASAKPLKDINHDGCAYCPHKSICRNPIAFQINGERSF